MIKKKQDWQLWAQDIGVMNLRRNGAIRVIGQRECENIRILRSDREKIQVEEFNFLIFINILKSKEKKVL